MSAATATETFDDFCARIGFVPNEWQVAYLAGENVEFERGVGKTTLLAARAAWMLARPNTALLLVGLHRPMAERLALKVLQYVAACGEEITDRTRQRFALSNGSSAEVRSTLELRHLWGSQFDFIFWDEQMMYYGEAAWSDRGIDSVIPPEDIYALLKPGGSILST